MMNEAVLRTILGRDETEALRVVEPLYSTGRTHAFSFACFGREGYANRPSVVFVKCALTRGILARIKLSSDCNAGHQKGACNTRLQDVWELVVHECTRRT